MKTFTENQARFRYLLMKYDLSVTRFSDMYDIPWVTVYSWYSGKRDPSTWTIDLIAESLERRSKNE